VYFNTQETEGKWWYKDKEETNLHQFSELLSRNQPNLLAQKYNGCLRTKIIEKPFQASGESLKRNLVKQIISWE